MRVMVQVRHFFNQQGLDAFPRLFEDHRKQVAAFPGFVTLRHSSTDDRNQALEVTLEFENEALLKNWRASTQHAEVAAAYRRFWTREPEVRISFGD